MGLKGLRAWSFLALPSAPWDSKRVCGAPDNYSVQRVRKADGKCADSLGVGLGNFQEQDCAGSYHFLPNRIGLDSLSSYA